jgi:pyrroline-5-carboxylate reductase
MNFAFVGGGNMGRALAEALIRRGVSEAKAILVFDPAAEAREQAQKLGCVTAGALDARVGQAAVVVLAVKPQQSPPVLAALKGLLGPDQVAVSIMAGVPLQRLREGLGHAAVVRVMPNTPAQIGLGMNVYFAPPEVSARQREAVERLLAASGEVLAARSEDAIDAATAVSGSGPAYVYYVAEHWMRGAVKLGFSEDEARRLVQQTLAGATALWKSQGLPAATLREQVTSKGGTTAAALEVFGARGVGDALAAGVERAYQRAKELGR